MTHAGPEAVVLGQLLGTTNENSAIVLRAISEGLTSLIDGVDRDVTSNAVVLGLNLDYILTPAVRTAIKRESDDNSTRNCLAS